MMANDFEYRSKVISITQNGRSYYVAKLPAAVLTEISYTAVRNKDSEEGAVQRVLERSRITGIKEFTLNGGSFPSTIILNWKDSEHKLRLDGDVLVIPRYQRAAQIVDGQHRIAGIKEALKEKPELRTFELAVVIYEGLTTKECADIFISINTEQKTVPKSLVFDLYGVASDYLVDPAALRARDIAIAMNDDPQSAYYRLIKLPGMDTAGNGIALQSIVNAIKPLVENRGRFEQLKFELFADQTKLLNNYFDALKKLYGSQWHDRKNVFMYSAGFQGAIEFYHTHLSVRCNAEKSFKSETIQQLLEPLGTTPIFQGEIKGLSGRTAINKVVELLIERFKYQQDRDEVAY